MADLISLLLLVPLVLLSCILTYADLVLVVFSCFRVEEHMVSLLVVREPLLESGCSKTAKVTVTRGSVVQMN